MQLLLFLFGVREALVLSNSNQYKDKLHRFESSPEHLLYCRFLTGIHYKLYFWWCCLFFFCEVRFIRRRGNGRVCSGSVRPGAACPCSGSLWKILTSIETRWAGSNPCLNTFYFCCFLKKGGLHAVSWCFLCNAQWFWCREELWGTGLATKQLRGSREQGSQEVGPSESTRGVQYKERGGMW